MAEERAPQLNESIEKDSVSSLSHDESSKQEVSAAETSKPEYRVDKFSDRIIQYQNSELKLYVDGKSFIGSGGFGSVRKYHHKEKIVAVKEFAIGGDDETITKIWNMVLREANILCRLQHENIVEILGVTQWPNVVGIIMEFVDGGNLENLLSDDNQSKLSWNNRLEIARGITCGLDYIHHQVDKKVFCHGDLKPANILLTAELQVKLADFGSAAFHRATAASTTTIKKVPTTQFTLIYVAPEFLVDNTQERSPAMDMYSFGMVLYELISGKAPYSDSTMPMHVPALIMAKIKPSAKLIDVAESQLQTDDDRADFSLLKKTMQKCWNNNPASRPSSKTVKMELSRSVINPSGSTSTKNEAGTVGVDTAGNKRENVTASSETDLTTQDENVPASTSSVFLSLFRDGQLLSSSDEVLPKQTSLEKITLEDIFKALDVFSPNQTSSEEGVGKAKLEDIFEALGTSTLLGNNTSVQDFLAKYTDSLLNKNFEQADIFRAALRALIMNDINAEAEDVRVFGERLHKEEKYLQSIAIFDTSAALFAKLKDPEEDLERIQYCVQGMKLASEKMIDDDDSLKVTVRDHVLPLMHGWLRQIKSATQVSEKWQCHVTSWTLSNIELCETWVDQWQESKRTLEEAVSGMRRVFGSEVHRLHGRLFGTLLNNLGINYKRESRFEEADVLFKESIAAHQAAQDYFDNEHERKRDIDISEKNLKSNLREIWEKQLKMK